MMKKCFILFIALSLSSEFIVSRPGTITIAAGSSIQQGRLALEWLHRVSEGVYIYSPIYYVNFQNSITVPQSFQSNSSFSMQKYDTEGFRLTLGNDALKRAQILFPINDNQNINYKYDLIGSIAERDSSNDSYSGS